MTNNRHSARSKVTGRFTSSGAPIPDEAGKGDTSAEAHVLAPSANPQGERDEPVGTVYPPHDGLHGGYQRPIQHRRQILIDSRTGQELDAHITHIRAVAARSVYGVGRHVVGVEDEVLGGFDAERHPHYDGPDTLRGDGGYARSRGGANGHRLPPVSVIRHRYDDEDGA